MQFEKGTLSNAHPRALEKSHMQERFTISHWRGFQLHHQVGPFKVDTESIRKRIVHQPDICSVKHEQRDDLTAGYRSVLVKDPSQRRHVCL